MACMHARRAAARGAAAIARDAAGRADPCLRRLPHGVSHSVCPVAAAPPLANDQVSHGSEEGRDRGCGQPDAYSEGAPRNAAKDARRATVGQRHGNKGFFCSDVD